jgi:hypothetical protein
MAEVDWKKMRNHFFWLNVHKHLVEKKTEIIVV